MLVAGAAMLVYVFDRCRGQRGQRGQRNPWYYFALPIVIFLIWQSVLRVNWGEFPILAGKSNMGIPFSSFIGLFLDSSSLQTPLQRRIFPELILLSVFALGVIYHLRSSVATVHEILSWFLYLALALSLSRAVWAEDWAFLRAVSEFCVLGIIIVIGANSRARAMTLMTFLIFWLYLFLRLYRHGY